VREVSACKQYEPTLVSIHIECVSPSNTLPGCTVAPSLILKPCTNFGLSDSEVPPGLMMRFTCTSKTKVVQYGVWCSLACGAVWLYGAV
jgi:hypothetical protein